MKNILGMSIVVTCLAASASVAVGATFNSVAECRDYSRDLNLKIMEVHGEESDCMKGPAGPFADVEVCAWDNAGARVSHSLTAWPQCKNFDVAECNLEIEVKEVDATCAQMAEALSDTATKAGEQAADNLETVNTTEGKASEALWQTLEIAQNFKNAAQRPKTILLGTYFLGGEGVGPGSDLQKFGDAVNGKASSLGDLLHAVSLLDKSHTDYIDQQIRVLFPSFERNSKSQLTAKDLDRLDEIIEGGSDAFFSENEGIKHMQKDFLDTIVKSEETLIDIGLTNYAAFESKTDKYYSHNPVRNTFTGNLEKLRAYYQRKQTQDDATDTADENLCDNDGVNVCAALSDILQALSNAALQQQAPAASGDGSVIGDDCGGRVSTGAPGEGRC